MMSLYGIPKASGICVDCKSAEATERDHRHYSLPLDVDYVCVKCNLRRGPAVDLNNLIRAHRGLTQLSDAEELRKAESIAAHSPTDLERQVDEFELSLIRRALQDQHGNRTAAARQLGLTFRQLRYKLQKYGI